MAKNAPIGLAGLVLVAASLVLLWFVILSGLVDSKPLNLVYFLRADTSGITGARDVTQWTYFFFCGQDNKDCSKAHAAPAFGGAWDSNPDNAPSALIGSEGGNTTSKKYYLMWRFGWVLLIIALFFEVVTLFSAFLACCGRLGAAVAGTMASLALFCFSAGVSVTTANFVSARNAFRKDGRDAEIGKYGFGFMWGSFAALVLATMVFVFGCFGGRKDKGSSGGSRGGLFNRRRKSQRSYDGRRVKDEYA